MHCEGDGFGGVQGALWGQKWQLGGSGSPTLQGQCHGGPWVMCHPPHPLPWGSLQHCLPGAHPVLLHGELLVGFSLGGEGCGGSCQPHQPLLMGAAPQGDPQGPARTPFPGTIYSRCLNSHLFFSQGLTEMVNYNPDILFTFLTRDLGEAGSGEQ